MARTLFAATVETTGVLQAIALARIGGGAEAILVGMKEAEESGDREAQERGSDEEELFHDDGRSSNTWSICNLHSEPVQTGSSTVR
jgi:hypothetical protein